MLANLAVTQRRAGMLARDISVPSPKSVPLGELTDRLRNFAAQRLTETARRWFSGPLSFSPEFHGDSALLPAFVNLSRSQRYTRGPSVTLWVALGPRTSRYETLSISAREVHRS